MIPLSLPARSDASEPFVTKLMCANPSGPATSSLVQNSAGSATFVGDHGLIEIQNAKPEELDRDVVLVRPEQGRADRLIRAKSSHNTLLVTESCDQLCVMCSQPPKKNHIDEFSHFKQACLLAEPGQVIGISGGEPTLFKDDLLGLLTTVLDSRPDLSFHVLTNAQHFEADDIRILSSPVFRRVVWGIPLYSHMAIRHDEIVGKPGAFENLKQNLGALMSAGARVELRTVVMSANCDELPDIARFVGCFLRFVEQWSLMQLEHIGFAKNRWGELYFDHGQNFRAIGNCIDLAQIFGINVVLFNFARCTVPEVYRHLAVRSISDWKRKFAPACGGCMEQHLCSGFFEWHPDRLLEEVRQI